MKTHVDLFVIEDEKICHSFQWNKSMVTCQTVDSLVCIHLRRILAQPPMLTVVISVDMILMIHANKHVYKLKINTKS